MYFASYQRYFFRQNWVHFVFVSVFLGADVERLRDIEGLDKEIQILQASNEQCARDTTELRKKVSAMETELKASQDEVSQARISHGIVETKLVILQTKFIASLSSLIHSISDGATLNYNTLDGCVDILREVFDQPQLNAPLIKQIKDALVGFNIWRLVS